MTFSEKLEEYFESLLYFNWHTFNMLSLEEQMQDWRSIFRKFERILRAEHEENSLDFECIYLTFHENKESLLELPIESIIYTRISSNFLVLRLYQTVKDLQFEIDKQQSTAACDCALAHTYSKTPSLGNLQEIKVLYDGYYNPTLFACKICGFEWISYISDDSIGRTVYEKYVP